MRNKILKSLIVTTFLCGAVYAAQNHSWNRPRHQPQHERFHPFLIGQALVENGYATIHDSRIKKDTVVIFYVVYGDRLKEENNVIVWVRDTGIIQFTIIKPGYTGTDFNDEALIHFAMYDGENSYGRPMF